MLWLWLFCMILIVVIIVLSLKICLLRKGADEIRGELAYSLEHESNNLISISTGDKRMRTLAGALNEELKLLRRARHRFQQGDREVKEAVADISHDLRTPLTAICGYLELLRGEEMSGEARRYLKIIEERTENLKELTEELFDYVVVESGSMRHYPEKIVEETVSRQGKRIQEIALNSTLEESISAYYAALVGCEITPRISIPEKKVIRRLDKRALSRIFGNILSNAIKYSDGDLSITLKEDGTILFENHASGLDAVQVSQLFNRFYTVETARKSTGLGLAVARSLAEQMQGEIDASYHNSILSIVLRFQ